MMSVKEYAQDVNKTVEEILNACRRLGIEVKEEDDMLEEDDIIELDNDTYEEELADDLEALAEEYNEEAKESNNNSKV